MAILTGILSLLGSSAVGSIIGGLFAFLNRKTDLESKKLDYLHEQSRWGHEVALRDKDIALAQAEAHGRKEVAIIEAEGEFEAARMQAVGLAQAGDRVSSEEIQAAGKLGWLYVLVGVFNKSIRPLATVIVVGAALYLNLMMLQALIDRWPDLAAPERVKLATEALAWLCGQASIIISYWFVSRGSSGNGQIK
jgi:hypothetical protein